MAVDTYGASLQDVDELVIWNVHRADDPSPAMVERWIEIGAAELSSQIGVLEGSCDDEALLTRARHVVALYAAAMAEAAHYPERATEGGDSYDAVLWRRHAEQIEALVGDVAACRAGTYGGVTPGAAHSLPEKPYFTSTMGF